MLRPSIKLCNVCHLCHNSDRGKTIKGIFIFEKNQSLFHFDSSRTKLKLEMKQVIAGVSGVASLALLGYIASRGNQHSISKRAIEFDEEIKVEETNSTLSQQEQWIQFLKDIHLDADQDVFEKIAQVPYDGNFANMRQFKAKQYAQVHDAMASENARRMAEAGNWADAIRPNIQQGASFKPAAGESGNCEWSSSSDRADEDGCVLRKGLFETSPHAASVIDQAGCSDESYTAFAGDDNTNIWFIVPRSIPLWARDEGSHVSDWVEYFNFIQSFTAKHFVRRHEGVLRLSVGLYMNGVQLIPRGVKMTNRNPLTRLTRWYSQPAISAQKPGFFKTLQSVANNLGRGAYVKNSGNGVLDGTSEAKDNCYMLMFIQDIPYDLNTIHVRTEENSRDRTGDFFDKINSVCTANYAFVMPGASDSESNAGKFIDQFELIAFPDRQKYWPWDPEYSGIYRLENFQQVSSPEFAAHVRTSMCMQSRRQQCKLSMHGKVIEPTVAEYDLEYYGEDNYANEYSAYDNSEVDYAEATEEPYYEMKSITEAPETAAPVAPQHECCGANIYGGHFNNVEKQCIYDFNAQENKIVSRESAGSDSVNYDYDASYSYDYKK